MSQVTKIVQSTIEMWNSGHSEDEIAKKWDVSRITIEKILIQNHMYYGDA